VKSFLLAIALFLSYSARTQIKWDGGGDGTSWSDNLNWLGDVLPVAGDSVLLDNSARNGNYTVLLPNGSVTITSLTILPFPGNTIRVVLPSSNLLMTNAFVATGPRYGLLIGDGGVFQNSSGSTSGTVLTIADSIRINDGGLYIHNSRSGHASLITVLSRAAGTENGTVEFDVPSTASYSVSISNRVYGNLVFSAVAAGGTKTYFSNGSNPFIIRGNWQIRPGVNYSLDLNDTVFVKGNFFQQSASFFNLASSTSNTILYLQKNITIDALTKLGTGLPQVHIAGSSNQNIIQTGTISNQIDWFMNNVGGATLLTNLSLPANLIMQAGQITIGEKTLSTHNLINGSPAAYIITNDTGYLKILNITNGPVNFPVGPDAGSYNPVTITNGGGIDFSVRVNQGINPPIAFPTSGINRTWHIKTSSDPVFPVTIGFQYSASDANSGCPPAGEMELLKYVPSAWNVIANNLTVSGSDPYSVSTVINSFNTPFALGRNGGWVLPVKLVRFDVIKSGNTISFNWELGSCCSPVSRFEIEESDDGKKFYRIGTVQANSNDRYYNYEQRMKRGIMFYRLRIIEEPGIVSYSRVVTIFYGKDEISIVSLTPILNSSFATVNIISSKSERIQMVITDMTGRIIRTQREQLIAGTNAIQLNCNKLGIGVYQVTCFTSQGKSNSFRFILNFK
jgi:hypothetical protein